MNVLCGETDEKSFWLYGLCGLCHGYSPLRAGNLAWTIGKPVGVAVHQENFIIDAGI